MPGHDGFDRWIPAAAIERSSTGKQIAAALAGAGFADVQAAYEQMKPVSTACVMAKARGGDGLKAVPYTKILQ